MKVRPKHPAIEAAAQMLPRQARQFFKSGDKTARHALRTTEVHRFRILTKRFRYELEYFSPCYGKALETYLELLKELQATLGALNDCTSSRELVADLSGGDPPRRHRKLFAAFDRREQQLLNEFREEWSQKFAPKELRQRWVRYLAHPPQRRPPAVRRAK